MRDDPTRQHRDPVPPIVFEGYLQSNTGQLGSQLTHDP